MTTGGVDDGDGTYVPVDDLAQVLAAALLDLDENVPPRVVARDPTTGRPLEVTGLRYDPRAHLIVVDLVGSERLRPPARWARPDDDASWIGLDLRPGRDLRAPSDSWTIRFKEHDAVDALRYAYGGFVPEPSVDRYARYEDPPDAGESSPPGEPDR